MKKEIRTVIFDMGRVLMDFSYEKVLSPWFPDPEDRRMMQGILFDSGDWGRADSGTPSEEEILAKWLGETPERLRGALREMFANWHTLLTPVEGMTELIRELKAAGYGCYLLSNTSMRFFTYWQQVEALCLLDGRFISAEHGLLKPDLAIYRNMTGLYGLDPEACYFVDDTLENVEAARSVGMRGFHFRTYDVEALRRDMKQEGIRIA